MYFGNPTTLSRQKILSPRLDLSIQTLKGARDNVKLLKFHDGEGLAATDERVPRREVCLRKGAIEVFKIF